MYIETDSSVRPDTNQLQYSLETLLAFVQNPTAPPSLPGVVVSVFALHSIIVCFAFALHTKCCRVLYNCSNIVGRGRGKLNHYFRMKHLGCPVLFGDKWILNKWIRWESQMFSRKCFLPKGSNYPSNLKIVEASL